MAHNRRTGAIGRPKRLRTGKEADTGIRALRKALRVTKADRLIRMLDQYSLGPFETEYPFARVTLGRQWLFDVAWPGLKVAVEIEGGIWGKGGQSGGQKCKLCGETPKGAHGSATGILRDIEKYNAGMMLGWRIYRVPTGAVNWATVRAIAGLLALARRTKRPPGRVGSTPRPALNVSTSRQLDGAP